MSPREQLRFYVQRIQHRLRVQTALRGAAILAIAALLATLLLVLIANAFAFSSISLISARSLLFLILVAAIAFAIAFPLLQINRRRASTVAEIAFPRFQERLITVAENEEKGHQPFLNLVASDALKISREAHPGSVVPGAPMLISAGVGVAALAILVWMILAAPGYMGYGASLLWTGSHATSPLYDLRVAPGDASVRRNADLLVTAQPFGIQAQSARIYARYESGSKWTQLPMQAEPNASGFQFLFAGLPEGVEYYVEAGKLHSRHFKIRVADLPSVKQIRVTYHFPAWTGTPDRIDENGGDLRAMEGTEARLEIHTDRPLGNGLLVLDGGQQLNLSPTGTPAGANVYTATIPVSKDGAYHVATVDQGQDTRISEDYFIEADKVNPPAVAISRPGGDYKASPIEEVTIAAKAADELGLSEFALHYSINGGPEQTLNVLQQKGSKSADASTVLHLEDFKVVPGDIVSVYASAKDAHAQARSDIAFIQTEPFEREFSQSQESPGGAGGGGGGAQDEISQREKEIISATWKQLDDTDSSDKAAENAKFLSGVQTKLHEQALSLAGRLEKRDLAEENDEFTDFQKDMYAAAEAMTPAAQILQHQKWKDAVPQEQKALQYLLRAEATFRQIQVAFGNAGGGAGGGGSAGRDLQSLFDLELDTQKNQYETGQTAQSADQRQQDIDEALRKLDELARRQDALAQQQNAQSSEQRWQQEMLRRQAEELQRQIEQMARNGQQNSTGSAGASGQSQGSQGQQGSQNSNDSRIQQALNQLKQANDEMGRATDHPQNGADARQASQRLKDAENLLNGMQRDQASRDLDGLSREADRLANEERDQASQMQKMTHPADPFGPGEQHPKLAQDRQQLGSDLEQLEKQMHDSVQSLSSTDRATASKLRDALRSLDESDMDDQIRRSADMLRRGLDPIFSNEPQIFHGLQQLNQQVQDARKTMGQGQAPGSDSQDALNKVQQLRDRLQAMNQNGTPGNNSSNPSNESPSGTSPNGGSPSGPNGSPNGSANGINSPRGDGRPGIEDGANWGAYGGGPDYGGLDWGQVRELPRPVGPSSTLTAPEQAYRESLQDLERLQESLMNDPEALKQVQDLIKQMQRLDPARFPGNSERVQQLLGQVLPGVDKLELQLRRDGGNQQQGQVRGADSMPVPPGYQDAVADYFRKLSKNP